MSFVQKGMLFKHFFFIPGSDLLGISGDITADQGIAICSPNDYGRFGTAVAMLDFNRDGVMDMGKKQH